MGANPPRVGGERGAGGGIYLQHQGRTPGSGEPYIGAGSKKNFSTFQTPAKQPQTKQALEFFWFRFTTVLTQANSNQDQIPQGLSPLSPKSSSAKVQPRPECSRSPQGSLCPAPQSSKPVPLSPSPRSPVASVSPDHTIIVPVEIKVVVTHCPTLPEASLFMLQES